VCRKRDPRGGLGAVEGTPKTAPKVSFLPPFHRYIDLRRLKRLGAQVGPTVERVLFSARIFHSYISNRKLSKTPFAILYASRISRAESACRT
jgi:hypothetical protein